MNDAAIYHLCAQVRRYFSIVYIPSQSHLGNKQGNNNHSNVAFLHGEPLDWGLWVVGLGCPKGARTSAHPSAWGVVLELDGCEPLPVPQSDISQSIFAADSPGKFHLAEIHSWIRKNTGQIVKRRESRDSILTQEQCRSGPLLFRNMLAHTTLKVTAFGRTM
jgi:hypothetical protein